MTTTRPNSLKALTKYFDIAERGGQAKPLQIISVLQGRRDVKRILSQWI